jgi:hypothetical protein
LPVTTLFVSANALLLIGLALLVVHHRIANQVELGAGGVERLERAIRAHGNLAEYAPLALILLAFLEFNGLPAWQLLALGGLFTVARLSHVHGMLAAAALSRTFGALFTVVTMLAMIGLLLLKVSFG